MNPYYQKSRKYKALNQNLEIISSHQIDDRTHQCIVNSPRTNNKYQVIISRKMQCSCPDFDNRHKPCKHIYFVISKVFKYDLHLINSQTHCLRLSELKNIFNNDDPNCGCESTFYCSDMELE